MQNKMLNYSSNGNPLQYSCLENPMDGGAWQAAVHGVSKSQTRLSVYFHFSLSCIGEGNGNPLQCSCLENPRDRGAWWAAVHGVAQSRIRLKRLSSSSSSDKISCNSVIISYYSILSNRVSNHSAGQVFFFPLCFLLFLLTFLIQLNLSFKYNLCCSKKYL